MLSTANSAALPDSERLKRVIIDVLLIEDEEYRDDHGPDEIPSWDSLAAVMIASGIQKEFGCPVAPDEIASFNTIGDIRQFCRSRGIAA